MSFPLVHDNAEVTIGDQRAWAARPAGLELDAGMLWVDPLDPAAVRFEITDPRCAQESVVALFGMQAWELITSGRDGEVRPGWALASARRAAVIGWLARYSPDPLNEDLLAMEAAVAARNVTDDPPVGPLRERAEEMLGSLGALPGLTALAAAYLDVSPITPTRRPAVHWPLGPTLTALDHGLLLDAEGIETGAWHSGGVDWDLVPHGAFDTAEDALSWGVEGGHLLVKARAGNRPEGCFIARLHSPDSILPTLVPLRLEGDAWVGTAPFHGDLADCWVDVTSAGDPRPARRDKARVQALARRWSARAVARLRFGVSQGYLLDCAQPLEEAGGCLERARIAYAETGNRDDLQRQFELGLTLRAALLHAGADYEVDDLNAELILEASSLGGPGAHAVDLTDPAWELTVAERALLVPESA